MNCPACNLPKVPLDRLYLMGAVTGIAMAEGKKHFGNYDAALRNAKWCESHRAELAALVGMAKKAMKP